MTVKERQPDYVWTFLDWISTCLEMKELFNNCMVTWSQTTFLFPVIINAAAPVSVHFYCQFVIVVCLTHGKQHCFLSIQFLWNLCDEVTIAFPPPAKRPAKFVPVKFWAHTRAHAGKRCNKRVSKFSTFITAVAFLLLGKVLKCSTFIAFVKFLLLLRPVSWVHPE